MARSLPSSHGQRDRDGQRMTYYQAGAFIFPVEGSYEAIKEYTILSSQKEASCGSTLNLQCNQRIDRAGVWREYARSVHRCVFPLLIIFPQALLTRHSPSDRYKKTPQTKTYLNKIHPVTVVLKQDVKKFEIILGLDYQFLHSG